MIMCTVPSNLLKIPPKIPNPTQVPTILPSSGKNASKTANNQPQNQSKSATNERNWSNKPKIAQTKQPKQVVLIIANKIAKIKHHSQLSYDLTINWVMVDLHMHVYALGHSKMTHKKSIPNQL